MLSKINKNYLEDISMNTLFHTIFKHSFKDEDEDDDTCLLKSEANYSGLVLLGLSHFPGLEFHVNT